MHSAFGICIICNVYLLFTVENPIIVNAWLHQSTLNVETKSTHFEFALISARLTHLKKKIKKSNFVWLALFFLVLLTILLIVRSFVKVLKWYCWDKNGLHNKDLNNFCIESVSGFLTHVLWAILFYLFQIFCQDKSVVFITLS